MENKKMNIALAIVICLVLVVVLIFISLKDKKNMPSNNNIGADDTNLENNTADNSVSDNGAATPSASAPANSAPADNSANDLEPAGSIAKTGDMIAVNYTGRLENGTVFDSNVDPKFNHVQPFEFTLGAGQVIPGWDKGIVGMKIGEKKTLTIPPADAYGSKAVGPIPANSTLIFDVELLAIKK